MLGKLSAEETLRGFEQSKGKIGRQIFLEGPRKPDGAHTQQAVGDPGGTPYRQDKEGRGRKGMRASSISSLLSSALGATICSRLSPPLGVDLQVAWRTPGIWDKKLPGNTSQHR